MKLNKNNYYSQQSNKEYMSYSQFKDFCECPAMAMAKINGEYEQEKTDSLLVGQYVDSWLDGDLDAFTELNPDIFNSRTGELKAQFKQADELCQIIESDKYLYKLLRGKRQKILTGSIAGVNFKCKIDSMLDDMTIDGKVLKDCNDVWIDSQKMPFYMANRYDIQAAIYSTLRKQVRQEDVPFVLAVVTKEKTPDKRLFMFSKETIATALQEVIAKAPVFQDIKDGKEQAWGCGKCDYCRQKKQLNKNDFEIL